MNKKNLIFILITFIILLLIFNISCNLKFNALENNEINLITDAKSGVLIECKTNTVLYNKNKDEKLAPASMTKIMTMLLVMEKIYSNQITLHDMVTTPKEASSLGGSQIYLEENEQMSVHDLLKAMCIASANDAAMSLAIYIGGTEKNFVKMMNDKVKQLKLQNTNFVNPYGFDDINHYSSSYDMACIASHLINNYPKILEYTSIYEDYVREDTEKRFWLVNTNKLVKFVNGVDGLKTGWTNNSGYCLTATISKNNERFIAVTMGNSSPSIRNSEVNGLLQYGVTNYKTISLLKKDVVIKEINDIKLNPKHVVLTSSKDVVIVINKNDKLKDYYVKENIDLENNNYFIDIYYDNKLYDRVYLTCNENINKSSIWDLFLEVIKEIFLGTK